MVNIHNLKQHQLAHLITFSFYQMSFFFFNYFHLWTILC